MNALENRERALKNAKVAYAGLNGDWLLGSATLKLHEIGFTESLPLFAASYSDHP